MSYAALVLKHILTGKDGVTHDIIRWLAVLAAAMGLGLEFYWVVIRQQPFDLQQFGIGCGALFVSVGAALALKANTEPTPPEPTQK
jgi:hypothetical protein